MLTQGLSQSDLVLDLFLASGIHDRFIPAEPDISYGYGGGNG